MAAVVYFVCALASIACAALLVRSWRRSRLRLLMWVALGFVGLAINNILLFVDRVVARDTDLHTPRDVSAFAAVAVILFGLIWESR